MEKPGQESLGGKFCVNMISTETPYQMISKLYIAGKQCYSSQDVKSIFEETYPECEDNREKMLSFVLRILSSGHESILENVSFMFAIEGVSRAMSHQLVRHRLASYMQQSQRRVNCEEFPFVTPPSIKANEEARAAFDVAMAEAAKAYKVLIGLHVPMEDARFVLPNACQTRLTMNANLRSLANFFGLRLCTKAQWEIRDVAFTMFRVVSNYLPEIMQNYGPQCVKSHMCPEAKSCGIFPERRKIIPYIDDHRSEIYVDDDAGSSVN